MDSKISRMANSGTSPRDVHSGFASAINNVMSSIGVDSGALPVQCFASEVNNALRSIGGDLDALAMHGFVLGANSVMSSIGEDSGSANTSLHGSASGVGSVMSSIEEDLGTSHSPVHGFASGVDDVMLHYRSFKLAELVAATNNFSIENKIGVGSFGVVYRGKLVDGREVAIKRGQTGPKKKELKEIGARFLLALLPRLHYKHLVGLVGLCEEKDEWILVYEYMKNGVLCDHLHNKNNVEKGSSVLNSWKMRIKIGLDASRGIEYLHNYADPCNIHKDIKSSNILLDATWKARVSDFVFTFLENRTETAGYIDPEDDDLNQFTAKNDVYGLGVVLLELLTGKGAIFKSGEGRGTRVSISNVVDFAVPSILAGELVQILDPRVGLPDTNEEEALEIVANTAIHYVKLEGKDRPTIVDIVVNLERALAICYSNSYNSISCSTISNVSE